MPQILMYVTMYVTMYVVVCVMKSCARSQNFNAVTSIRHNARNNASKNVIATSLESARRALQHARVTSISYSWVRVEWQLQ